MNKQKLDTIESGKWYHVYKPGKAKPNLVYCYFSSDYRKLGFSFNYIDGGGFIAVEDIPCTHRVIPIVIVEKPITEYKNYRKKLLQPMRPYILGEDLSNVSISTPDIPGEGGMIAVNPNDPKDQWYVAKKFYEDNYELVEE